MHIVETLCFQEAVINRIYINHLSCFIFICKTHSTAHITEHTAAHTCTHTNINTNTHTHTQRSAAQHSTAQHSTARTQIHAHK